MGDVYTDNYAAAFNQSPGKLISSEYWGAEKRTYGGNPGDKYEADALPSGSVIHVCRPPKGWRLQGGKITSDDLGNNTTLAVGTGVTGAGVAADPDKFMAATNHGGGAAVQTPLLGAAQIDAIGHEFDGETDLIITTGTGAATGTIVPLFEFSCAH